MEDADNITLLAQIVMENHEVLMQDHAILVEVRDTLAKDHTTLAEHTDTLSTHANILNDVRETLGRMEHKLDAVATLSKRHEKWITKTAPVVGVRYPTRP